LEDVVLPVTYFAEPGPQNTETTLQRALERARALSLTQVLVASDTGKTARRVLELFPRPPFSVTVVTNPPGTELPLEILHEYLPRFKKHKRELEAKGVSWVQASLADDAIDELSRAGARVLSVDWAELAEFTSSDLSALDRVGVGLRVGVTLTLAAHLAGAVAPGTEVLTITGTGFGGGGADTALVVRTGAVWKDWRVLETITRPRLSPPSET
jgi:uncharacterized protein